MYVLYHNSAAERKGVRKILSRVAAHDSAREEGMGNGERGMGNGRVERVELWGPRAVIGARAPLQVRLSWMRAWRR